jgi:hypothetical protein
LIPCPRADRHVLCNCVESKAHVAGTEVLAAESIKLLTNQTQFKV